MFGSRTRQVAALVAAVLVTTAAPAPAEPARTTLGFVAHQDDDLLFMNPDILSDVQAGHAVWVVYLTAGELPCDEGFPACGMAYADMRVHGERAAYARAAKVPNRWVYEAMWFNGHEVPTNRLEGTDVRLVFTFVHAAGGSDQCGDLYRLAHQPGFVARPIDGRAAYTRASFVEMLRDVIHTAGPDLIRSQSSIGHRQPDPDHVDHVAGAVLAAEADTDAAGNTLVRRDEYDGYVIRQYPDNVAGYWRDEKTAVWDRYWPHDPALGPDSWREVMGRQYSPDGRVFHPGVPWVPPGDIRC
ncbi:PIG-L family deacetylase [Saccharothrix longispora]|uniref:LmbE family N-acetylglucosaminyl deacetylase n=1 Tax=Saccharothrix longispora TaxID=33920 RepID=A0ABU1PVV4_9PSEU|nr:PIG-L family deacetylase [Saccharothrix longispora]MDR6594754.1 LmbE family N-acetylglucosaminyl deacetylase [Saccharothrix longispora]